MNPTNRNHLDFLFRQLSKKAFIQLSHEHLTFLKIHEQKDQLAKKTNWSLLNNKLEITTIIIPRTLFFILEQTQILILRTNTNILESLEQFLNSLLTKTQQIQNLRTNTQILILEQTLIKKQQQNKP